jgi:hypothetical protein
MRASLCLKVLITIVAVLVLSPTATLSQEEGRPEAGRDPRLGVESDLRREETEARREEWNTSSAEAVGRRTDLTKRQNPEFHDIDTLARDIQAETTQAKPIDVDPNGQPASEKQARDIAKQIERDLGPDARREFHDMKEPGTGDRTAAELKQDAQDLYSQAGKSIPRWISENRSKQ